MLFPLARNLSSFSDASAPSSDHSLASGGHVLTLGGEDHAAFRSAFGPLLLSHEGPAFVLDPGGHIHSQTAAWRRAIGQEEEDPDSGKRLLCIDPFGVCIPFFSEEDDLEKTDLEEGDSENEDSENEDSEEWETEGKNLCGYDPLGLIDINSGFASDDAKMYAGVIVRRGGHGGDQLWDEMARNFLAGLILYVCHTEEGRYRSLAYLRHLLMLPEDIEQKKAQDASGRFGTNIRLLLGLDKDFPEPRKGYETQNNLYLENISDATGRPTTRKGLIDDMMRHQKVAGGNIARAAKEFWQRPEKMQAGVLIITRTATDFLDSAKIAEATIEGESPQEIAGLLRSGATVYAALPDEFGGTYRAWNGLVAAGMVTALARIKERPSKQIAVVIPEFEKLGRIEPLVTVLSLFAGYGISLWLSSKGGLGSIEEVYGKDAGSIVGNAETVQIFQTGDEETESFFRAQLASTWDDPHSFCGTGRPEQGLGDSDLGLRYPTDPLMRLFHLEKEPLSSLGMSRQALLMRGLPPFLPDRLDVRVDRPYYQRLDRRRSGGTF